MVHVKFKNNQLDKEAEFSALSFLYANKEIPLLKQQEEIPFIKNPSDYQQLPQHLNLDTEL